MPVVRFLHNSPTMTNTLRFGCIGAGQISLSGVQSINKHPNASVIAATDPNAGRLKELCTEGCIPNAYVTSEELLADKTIDAVYIAVPNKFHVPLSIQALEAGKHVILDKPFAMNIAEAEAAAAAAKKAGKVLTLGMNQRFNGNSQKFRSLAEAGTFGEIYHAKAAWTRRSGIPKLGTWFGNRELAGAGCLYDIGVHVLDLCLYVINNFKPVSVYGATYTKFGNRGLGAGSWGKSESTDLPFTVDDFATGLIKFENGATVSLDVTWACHRADGDRVEVDLFGTEAGGSVFANKLYRRDESAKAHVIVDNPPASMRFPHCDRFHNFINHLLGTEDLCVPLEQALTIQRILDGLAASASTGREVLI